MPTKSPVVTTEQLQLKEGVYFRSVPFRYAYQPGSPKVDYLLNQCVTAVMGRDDRRRQHTLDRIVVEDGEQDGGVGRRGKVGLPVERIERE